MSIRVELPIENSCWWHERRLADHLVADERSVGGLQVHERHALARDLDRRVVARDLGVLEHEVAVLRAR